MNNIENVYKKAFANAKEMPHEKILKGVQSKMERKPIKKRKTIVFVLAACFLLVTTVAAAGINFGGFDWLTERLGGDAADRLQPIGLGLTYVRQGDIYLTDDFTADGVRVELIAVGATDYELDIFILLEDLTDNRVWGNEIQVQHILRFTDPALALLDPIFGAGRSAEFNVIERDDIARKAVFHSRMSHPSLPYNADTTGINTRDLTLLVEKIIFDQTFYENIDPNVNLAELLNNPSPTRTITYEEAQILGAFGRHRSISEGDVVLVPSKNIPLMDNRISISAAAEVDGKLHLQFYGGGTAVALPVLINPSGEMIEEYFLTMFTLDENNDFMSLRIIDEYGNWLYQGNENYIEFVFDINTDNLQEYGLFFLYFATEDHILLNRTVSFELRDIVGIPHQLSPEERAEAHILFHDTLMEDIFGSPRVIRFYDEEDILEGYIFVRTMNLTHGGHEPTREGVQHIEVAVTFVGEYGLFIQSVRDEPELIPSHLYDEIMYHANRWYSVEYELN